MTFKKQERYEHAYISFKENHSLTTVKKTKTSLKHNLHHYNNQVDITKELAIAKRTYDEMVKIVMRSLSIDVQNKNLAISAITAHLNKCANSIIRNPDALMWLASVKPFDRDSITLGIHHGIHVAIVGMAFGRALGMSPENIVILGQCGLTLKIDNLQITHSQMPEKLNHFIRIISIIDVYETLLHEGTGRQTRSTASALKILYTGRGKKFDETLVVEFMKFIGFFPPGSLIELKTGEVGIVLSRNEKRKLSPKIALVLNPKKQPTKPDVVDLSEFYNDNCSPIQRVLTSASFGIDLRQFMESSCLFTISSLCANK